MYIDINAIWAEIKKGDEGDVVGVLFTAIEDFFNNLLNFLRSELL